MLCSLPRGRCSTSGARGGRASPTAATAPGISPAPSAPSADVGFHSPRSSVTASRAWCVRSRLPRRDSWGFLGFFCRLAGLGVAGGSRRLLPPRRFKTTPLLRGVLAALGSAAVEGEVISWVANHRRHHAFSDEEG